MFQNMTNEIDFNIIFEQLQDCFSYNGEVAKNYFNLQYKELIKRKENEKEDKVSIPLLSMFLNLPIFIVERIHEMFFNVGHRGDYFVRGMHDLYFGSFEILTDLTFNILDLSGSKRIYKKDVLNILNYLNMDCTFTGNLKELVKDFFDNKHSLEFHEYVETILTNNSDVFILILLCIYQNQPFSNLSFEQFKINFENNLRNEIKFFNPIKNRAHFLFGDEITQEKEANEKIKRKEKTFIIKKPMIEFSIGYEKNKKITSINQTEEDSSILDFEEFVNFYGNLSDESFDSINSKAKLSKQENFNKSFSSDAKTKETPQINLNDSFTFTFYKFENNTKITFQALLIQDTVLIKSQISENNSTRIKEIIHLPSLFVQIDESIIVDDQVYFAIQLTNKYLNTNSPRIFYFKCNKLRDKLYQEICEIINVRNICKNFSISKKIGEGNFGKVYLAEDIYNKKKVAIKKIRKKCLHALESKYIISEINIIKFLIKNKNENIINVLDIYENKNNIYFVIDYCDMGDLESFLRSENKEYLELIKNNKENVALQITNGIQFLHDNGIVHRDLKQSNILLSKEKDKLIIKISDFGVSRFIGQTQLVDENCGSLIYLAPEILANKRSGKNVDIWTYGILLYFLFFDIFPFNYAELTKEQIIKKICNLNVTFPKSSGVKTHIKFLIFKCLSNKCTERVSINTVARLGFFMSNNMLNFK